MSLQRLLLPEYTNLPYFTCKAYLQLKWVVDVGLTGEECDVRKHVTHVMRGNKASFGVENVTSITLKVVVCFQLMVSYIQV